MSEKNQPKYETLTLGQAIDAAASDEKVEWSAVYIKQGEELKEEVCFVDIVVFGKQAEHCGQYLSKGNGAIIEGRLQQRRWETEDGQKRSKHEVVAQSVTFMPKRQDGGGASGGPGGEPPIHDEPSYEYDEQH